MLLVYPMLTSSTAQNNNVIPAITKVLERYILVYSLNRSISIFNKTQENLNIIDEGRPTVGIKAQSGKEGSKNPSEYRVDIYPGNQDVLTLEPTWVKVEFGNKSYMVGVKVVPFTVKSDESLLDLINSDLGKSKIDTFLTSKGRKYLIRLLKMWRPIAKRIPGMGHESLTGDPLKDIIWAYSRYEKRIFCAIDKSELSEDIYKTPKKISKLFKLHWTSFVFLDDINKEAIFCPDEFQGLCSTLPYSYLMSSFKRELGQAYKDKEEIARSSSPFFKMKTPLSKIVGEQLAQEKLSVFRGLRLSE